MTLLDASIWWRLPQQVVPFDVLPEFGHLEMHV
jgi:hypothetical protein